MMTSSMSKKENDKIGASSGKKEDASSSAVVPESVAEAVLVKSEELPVEYSKVVKGYDFNKGVNHEALLAQFRYSGFQATNFGLGVERVKEMIAKREEAVPEDKAELMADDRTTPLENPPSSKKSKPTFTDWNPEVKPKNNCTIFLGYTSNMVSCGTRETIRFLAQHKMVDVMVTTAGGIEEDFIKCMADTYIGDFALDGRNLRKKGINRIGNLLVPNDNYCGFEDWIMPIFDKMLEEQKEHGIVWTPSKLIHRLGLEINHEDSIYYWAAKNDIPVFSPAITDGSIGDMLFFHSFKNPGLILDIVQDVRSINQMAIKAINTGMIILGGGVIKHHITNANLMRNGANYSVFVNTASEYDGSDSGARPDEAISWGKIRADAQPVKIYGENSIIFPLMVAETFAKRHFQNSNGCHSEHKNIIK